MGTLLRSTIRCSNLTRNSSICCSWLLDLSIGSIKFISRARCISSSIKAPTVKVELYQLINQTKSKSTSLHLSWKDLILFTNAYFNLYVYLTDFLKLTTTLSKAFSILASMSLNYL